MAGYGLARGAHRKVNNARTGYLGQRLPCEVVRCLDVSQQKPILNAPKFRAGSMPTESGGCRPERCGRSGGCLPKLFFDAIENGSVRPDLLDLVPIRKRFVFGYRFPREWPDSIIAMVISSSPGSTGCVRTKLQMNDVLPVDGGSR